MMSNKIHSSLLYKQKEVVDGQKENNAHASLLNFISNDAIVLDVGCSCGDLGSSLKMYRNSELYGLEYDADAIEIAKKTGVYKEIHQVDLDSFSVDDFEYYKEKFDYILCGDVLEHLRFPLKILKLLAQYLKKDGFFVASIPNVAHTSIKANLLVNDFTYTPVGLLDETHVHLFTDKSIAKLFAEAGLEIIDCDWTAEKINGNQPNNPYPNLPKSIKNFLFSDWSSYICQYIVKARVVGFADAYNENLNKIRMNDNNAPDFFKDYRTNILASLNETGSNIDDVKIVTHSKSFRIEKKYKTFKRLSVVLSLLVLILVFSFIYCLLRS